MTNRWEEVGVSLCLWGYWLDESSHRGGRMSAYQERREGSGPLTARQPGFAAKVPKPARRRER